MSKRLCVCCKSFWFYGGSIGYSEATPANAAEVGCRKKHFEERCLHGMLAEDFRRLIAQAESCADFQISDDATEPPA